MAYRGLRFLSFNGRVQPGVLPTRGVVAGCSFADLWVRVYTLEAYSAFASRHPKVRLDTYVDDLHVEAVGKEASVINSLRAAAQDLEECIELELGGEISLPKAATIASTEGLRNKLRKALRKYAGKGGVSTRNLGIDDAGGELRAHWCGHQASVAGFGQLWPRNDSGLQKASFQTFTFQIVLWTLGF